jgi:NAD(P)-dependent dehydrogenase (short-subunit alcohol dehydrogenase family)
MEISGRNALITGGAHRVGKGLTLMLAAAGANVYIHYNSSAGPAEETAGEAEAMGVRVAIGASNLRDPSTAGDLVADATAALGPVSILINSASGFPTDTLMDVSADGIRDAYDLTLGSPVMLTQAFAAALPNDQTGAVINVTDVKTLRPYTKHFSYILAKGALDTFTRAAAVALGPRIRVNAVALGVILPPPGEDDEYASRISAGNPIPGAGGTDPVAAAARALIENDFVTGEIIRLDGGSHLV